ncbi:PorP/SprF family type IX secretion system membrane protein [Reichenbachiella versicolor]|uniref:PorP/SprF family type IX secretion system membrane protein n=1 Tax=Reichenbachiella versicolor TaxID=1821036 RepID=UPI000D6E20D7|nr:PorP/SprF family type IX secretion system membrane protein [Reichenbachiella versicolor]
MKLKKQKRKILLLKKEYLILFFTTLLCSVKQVSWAQQQLLGQYFNIMQTYAPGLTGANDYLDINLGTRQQWRNTDGAPKSNFFNANSTLLVNRMNPHEYNSIRVSDMSPYKKKNLKMGVGGYFMQNSVGPIDRTHLMASTALHVLVLRDSYLSLGISTGYILEQVDLRDLTVLNPNNDQVYQAYLSQGTSASYMDNHIGLAFYSSRFYFSYSMISYLNSKLGRNEAFRQNSTDLTHNFLGGVRLSLNQFFELTPNFFLRKTPQTPTLLDAGVRLSYMNDLMLGLSYRNDKSFISMIRIAFKSIYSVTYSYEFKTANQNVRDLNTHELTIGVQLFNNQKYKPVW